MLAEGSEVWNLESEGCMTFMAVSARQNRIMIVLSENCSFQPPRFSLMWRSGTLSSPGHRWFASSAEAEVHAGASARSRAAIVRPGRASENWSVRILIAYSIPRVDLLLARASRSRSRQIYQSYGSATSSYVLSASFEGLLKSTRSVRQYTRAIYHNASPYTRSKNSNNHRLYRDTMPLTFR